MTDTQTGPYGLLVLRLALGAMWVSHGLMKLMLFTIPGFAGFLGSQGMPSFLAAPIIFAEIIGGLLIIAGFYGRQVSVVLLPIMIGALMVHVPNGWVFSAPKGGWEYPAFLIVASVAHALAGDGALALRSGPLAFWRSSPRSALSAA
jgi:putative oxidoreductase